MIFSKCDVHNCPKTVHNRPIFLPWIHATAEKPSRDKCRYKNEEGEDMSLAGSI